MVYVKDTVFRLPLISYGDSGWMTHKHVTYEVKEVLVNGYHLHILISEARLILYDLSGSFEKLKSSLICEEPRKQNHHVICNVSVDGLALLGAQYR